MTEVDIDLLEVVEAINNVNRYLKDNENVDTALVTSATNLIQVTLRKISASHFDSELVSVLRMYGTTFGQSVSRLQNIVIYYGWGPDSVMAEHIKNIITQTELMKG